MLLEKVIGDASKRKWAKDSDELKRLYKLNKEAFTEISMEIMLKIMQLNNAKQCEELSGVYLQMYAVIN